MKCVVVLKDVDGDMIVNEFEVENTIEAVKAVIDEEFWDSIEKVEIAENYEVFEVGDWGTKVVVVKLKE